MIPTSELVMWLLSLVSGIILIIVTYTLSNLNKTIKELQINVGEIKEFAVEQNVINKQMEKLTYVIEKMEQRILQSETRMERLNVEHKLYHKKKEDNND